MSTVRRHGNVGEMCAFGLRDRRTYTVTAMETTELMSLSKESLLTQLAQLCPNVVEDLRRRVYTKYRRLRRVTKEGHDSSPKGGTKNVAKKVVGMLETIMSATGSTVVPQDSSKVVPETTPSPPSSPTTRRGDMVASDVEDFVLSNQEEEEEENPAVDESDSEEEESKAVEPHQQQQIQYEKLSAKVDAMYDLLRVIAENTKNSAAIRNHVARGSSGPM